MINNKANICILCLIILIFINKANARVIDSDELKKTSITPVLDAKIEKGKNLVFCSTLQMAWNKICNDIEGEPLNVIDPPWYVKPLNALIKQPALLGEDSYFSMAGFKKDNIVEKINKGLREKFKNLSESELVKVEDTLKFPYDIMAFSYFYKNLEFETPFSKTSPNDFINDDSERLEIKTFGINDIDEPQYKKLLSQVNLLYYNSAREKNVQMPEGFVIELKTKSATDELLISTLKAEDTLEKTYKKIVDCIQKNTNLNLKNKYTIDALKVPYVKFNFWHSYKDLSGKEINIKKSSDAKLKYNIGGVYQKINFTLNESGVRLESYSLIMFIGRGEQLISLNVILPFVIALRSKGAEAPYFMAYIANEEFLETIDPYLIPIYTENGLEYTSEVKITIGEAIRNGANIKAIKKLIDSGVDTSELSVINIHGRKPVELAFESDDYELMKLLIEKCGVDVSEIGSHLLYLLSIDKKINDNIEQNSLKLNKIRDVKLKKMKLLLNRKINELDTTEIMFNFLYSSDSCEEFVEELIDHGADFNKKNPDGDTLLIIAAKKKMRPEFIKSLIKRGADVKALDKKGHDALYYARENKMDDVVKMLEEKLK